MRVVIAPDSFKGTATAAEIAAAIGDGWHAERPDDDVVLVPMADGGEGTLDAFATVCPDAERIPITVTGPDDEPVHTHWLRLPDGRAVVELAATSGITLLDPLRPDTAHSSGFGEAIAAALDAGATGLVLGIGGSASTDGGVGMLAALGLGLSTSTEGTSTGGASTGGASTDGASTGGASTDGASTDGASTDGASTDGASTVGATGGLLLDAVTGVDRSGLRPLPPGGATVLTDVTAPLCGPTGAAAVFGPQKGVTPDRIDVHDARLARWAGRFPEIDPTTPGAGAAGGVGFGLLVWGATLARGAEAVSDAVGLPAAIGPADVVVTGEGRFDGQSATGKVPAVVARLAGGRRRMLVAGAIEAAVDDFMSAASLTVIATQTTGEPDDALRDPLRFARLAGGRLARRATEHDESMRDESMHHEAERGAGAPGT